MKILSFCLIKKKTEMILDNVIEIHTTKTLAPLLAIPAENTRT